MESYETDSITAFDTLYTTNHLQMLKILLPYMQSEMQSHIAVYIKLNELLVTLQFTQSSHPHSFDQRNTSGAASYYSKKEPDMQSLYCELAPYLNGNEKDMLQKLADMKDNMEKFKQMSQMMQMMEEMSDSPESVLQSYLSEEQLAMFKMFQEDLS